FVQVILAIQKCYLHLNHAQKCDHGPARSSRSIVSLFTGTAGFDYSKIAGFDMMKFFPLTGTAMTNARLFTVLTCVLLGILSRFLPHPPNFTAINAIGLFGASTLGSLPLSLCTLFAALFLSDLVIGFYPDMFFVYLSFGLIVLIGRWLHSTQSIYRIATALALSSLTFFLITNFGVWLTYSLYPKTCAGLGLCYIAAIPFSLNQILGDLFYGIVMFGCLAFVETRTLTNFSQALGGSIMKKLSS
ncbi:MAG: DUF6580 family putative transport protein, partial [Parachlamydiaceae bacterium]